MTAHQDIVGVVGAGTMGAGIAQLAAQAGRPTLVYDAVPEAIHRGLERVATALERQVAKARMRPDEAAAVRARLRPAPDIADQAPCGTVIEAAPERLDLKLEPEARQRAEAFFASLGLLVEEVRDAPGLVLGRIVCQLIIEAAFLIGEGNGSAADVDAGMELGVNHPRGPVAWASAIGLEHVVGVLDALHAELGDPRYRVAPLLRQRLATA